MNRILKTITALTVAALCGYPAVSQASDTIQAYLFPSHLQINGSPAEMPDEYDVINYKEHAYVPVRFITEQLNGKVSFDDNTQNISLSFSSFGHLAKDYTKDMAEKNKDIIYDSPSKIKNVDKFYDFLKDNSDDAWIRISRFTIEGDAIIVEIKKSETGLEYFYDNSRDGFGEPLQYITSAKSISEVKLNDGGLYEYRLEGASFLKNEDVILLRVQK
jgi:hypothetical protein